MFDLIKEIWQTMRTSKLRTLLTGISVAWGIFMLILLLSISNGVVNQTAEFAQSSDPNRITVWGGRTSMPYKGLKEGRRIDLRDKYMPDIASSNPQHIANVEGLLSIAGTISTPKDYITGSCTGVYPSKFNKRYKLAQGRYINDADLKNQRKVLVLPSTALKTLFADTTNVVGKVVNIGNLAFTLVGVYQHDWDDDKYIPFTTAQALSGYKGEVDQIEVRITGVKDETESGAIEDQVVQALSKSAQFDPEDKSAVWTYDRFASYVNSQAATKYLTIAMWVIGLLTLITGIVGVSNIMFVSVRERTHEIGIRRAIGAKPRSILTQVVLESVALTTVFGYIGIVMGTFATEIVKYVFADSNFMLNPTVDLSIAIEVIIALIISGALAGLFPALRALKVKPVEALRDE